MLSILDVIERKTQNNEREVNLFEVEKLLNISRGTAFGLMLDAMMLGLLKMEVPSKDEIRFVIPEQITVNNLTPQDAIMLYRKLARRPELKPAPDALPEAGVTRMILRRPDNPETTKERHRIERHNLVLFSGTHSAVSHGGIDLANGIVAFSFGRDLSLSTRISRASKLGFERLKISKQNFLKLIPLLPQFGFEQAGIELDPELDDADEAEYLTSCILRARKGETDHLLEYLKALDHTDIRSMEFLDVPESGKTGRITLYKYGLLYTHGEAGILERIRPILSALND